MYPNIRKKIVFVKYYYQLFKNKIRKDNKIYEISSGLGRWCAKKFTGW